MLFQPRFDARLVGIEFAGAVGPLVFVIRMTQPVTDGFSVQLEFACNLAGGELFILMERADLANPALRRKTRARPMPARDLLPFSLPSPWEPYCDS